MTGASTFEGWRLRVVHIAFQSHLHVTHDSCVTWLNDKSSMCHTWLMCDMTQHMTHVWHDSTHDSCVTWLNDMVESSICLRVLHTICLRVLHTAPKPWCSDAGAAMQVQQGRWWCTHTHTHAMQVMMHTHTHTCEAGDDAHTHTHMRGRWWCSWHALMLMMLMTTCCRTLMRVDGADHANDLHFDGADDAKDLDAADAKDLLSNPKPLMQLMLMTCCQTLNPWNSWCYTPADKPALSAMSLLTKVKSFVPQVFSK